MTDTAPARTVYSVSELTAATRELLEHSFPLLWVEGEISNLARPRSGHWYFTLKDDKAQVRCAMFANRNRLLKQPPAEGDQILVRARVSLYAVRGDFQLIVESLEGAGEGALRRAFEQLRDRLAAEGLFDEAHKQALPDLPRRIGVITSATGASIRDVCSVLRRRYPLGRAIVHAVPVQGEAAPSAIVQALGVAAERAECDVLLLVRGGGSLEDLQAFNDEGVARAIRACPIPVVAGIGHEVDVTIADFAADVRAPTPSAAAELVCPDLDERLRHAGRLHQRVAAAVIRRLTDAGRRLHAARRRLGGAHPQRQLERRMQRLDELELRVRRNADWQLERRCIRLRAATAGLAARHPRQRLREDRRRLDRADERLLAAIHHQLNRAGERYRLASAGLNAMSPLRTLARGYAIVENDQQRVVTDSNALATGDRIKVRLYRGYLDARVEETHAATPSDRDKV